MTTSLTRNRLRTYWTSTVKEYLSGSYVEADLLASVAVEYMEHISALTYGT